jgi:phytoene synthase
MAVEEKYSTITSVLSVEPSYRIAKPADYLACRQVMLKSSRNYSYASRFLPADKLPHVEALYALMRVGDDRVDVSHDGFSSPLAAIEDWEATYWRAFERYDSTDPIMRAYLNTAIQFGIPEETMTEYFRAMKDDLTVRRYRTFDDLLYYMGGSAIPVGRAMTYILGVDRRYSIYDALAGADSLSIAMQLSNFWRDIGADYAQIDRVYIPQEDMQAFGYTEDDLRADRIDERLIALMEYEFERTNAYYRQAAASVPKLASGRWGVMSSLLVYQGILSSIRRNGYDVFNRRARADKLRKLGFVAQAGLHTFLR